MSGSISGCNDLDALSSFTRWRCCAVCVIEEHHKRTPVFSELPLQLGQLIVRSIAINSAYTSRVLVSSHSPYVLTQPATGRMSSQG